MKIWITISQNLAMTFVALDTTRYNAKEFIERWSLKMIHFESKR